MSKQRHSRHQQNCYYLALQDLFQTVLRIRLWLHLGWRDIKYRYRGSVLGPFWITLSMVIWIGALSVVYTKLFHQDIKTFIPFLSSGILVWIFISSTVIESSDIFINNKNFIGNVKLPYLLFNMHMLWRNMIILFHNFVVFAIVAVIFRVNVSYQTLLFIPGIILLVLSLLPVTILISMIGTRFRDVPPVVNSLVTVTFFVSPVTWQASMLGNGSKIVRFNPVSHYLDLVRSPLLGMAPQAETYIFCVSIAIVLYIVAFYLFAKFRKRIVFWL